MMDLAIHEMLWKSIAFDLPMMREINLGSPILTNNFVLQHLFPGGSWPPDQTTRLRSASGKGKGGKEASAKSTSRAEQSCVKTEREIHGRDGRRQFHANLFVKEGGGWKTGSSRSYKLEICEENPGGRSKSLLQLRATHAGNKEKMHLFCLKIRKVKILHFWQQQCSPPNISYDKSFFFHFMIQTY